MRRKPVPTRLGQIKQQIIDWLLNVTLEHVLFFLILLGVLVVIIVLLYSLLFPVQCAEGYVYMRGVCVMGYKP